MAKRPLAPRRHQKCRRPPRSEIGIGSSAVQNRVALSAVGEHNRRRSHDDKSGYEHKVALQNGVFGPRRCHSTAAAQRQPRTAAIIHDSSVTTAISTLAVTTLGPGEEVGGS